MQNYSLYLTLFITNCFSIYAQELQFTSNCSRAYNDMIALRMSSASNILKEEQKEHPNNHLVHLCYSYIDFLELYTTGSHTLYEQKKDAFKERLSIFKNADESSPYYNYSQGMIYLQSAVLHIKFSEYLSAVMNIKRAVSKLEKNQKEFPDFIPNKMGLGLLYAVLGSVPKKFKFGLDILGLDGNIEKGLSWLKYAAEHPKNPFIHEAKTVYAFLLLHVGNKGEDAWSYIQNNSFDEKANKMDCYTLAHIALYTNRTDIAIKHLKNTPKSQEYIDFPLLDYMLGLAKTTRLDEDASLYLKKFLQRNKGQDYIKSSLQKLAWNAIIKHNYAEYHTYIKRIKNEGRTIIDADKQAQLEAENQKLPNIELLKARLLSDGGFLNRALNIMNALSIEQFKNSEDKTLYYYRMARIYHKMNNLDQAIKYYEFTLEYGAAIQHYYVANTAYELGRIYEIKNNKTFAINYYKKALQMDGYEYDNSINQKAQAALNRLK